MRGDDGGRAFRGVWPITTLSMAAILLAVGLAVLPIGPGEVGVRAVRALLVQTAVAVAVFDARHLLIPDLYSAAFAFAGVIGPLSPGLAPALAGAAVGAGLTGVVRLAAGRALGREAMGWGDVKLAAGVGAVLGPLSLLWALAAAAGVGAAVGLALRRRGGPEAVVPFGALLAPAGALWLWLAAPP